MKKVRNRVSQTNVCMHVLTRMLSKDALLVTSYKRSRAEERKKTDIFEILFFLTVSV